MFRFPGQFFPCGLFSQFSMTYKPLFSSGADTSVLVGFNHFPSSTSEPFLSTPEAASLLRQSQMHCYHMISVVIFNHKGIHTARSAWFCSLPPCRSSPPPHSELPRCPLPCRKSAAKGLTILMYTVQVTPRVACQLVCHNRR